MESGIASPYFSIDSLKVVADSLSLPSSILNDSTSIYDSVKVKKKKRNEIESPVKYNAKDSIIFSLAEKKVYLFGEAEIYYGSIELKAEYIEFDMSTKIVFARGIADSTGALIGNPQFKDDGEEFKSKEILYNFEVKKGVITDVITSQEGGYLHGQTLKRHPNEHIHIKNGKYTTCELEHPHFYLKLSRAEVIPDDKIVTGPAYLVLEDLPLYFIGLPFAFMPNTKKAKSGILIPEYGEETYRGFFLREGGYYFAISEYFDLTTRGTIYTNGTWGASLGSNYKVRYKYNGSFNATYYNNVSGEQGIDAITQKDMSIRWNHMQDSKANPFASFNAMVDFSTTSYDQNQSYSYDYINNTKSSSISYNRRWANRPLNFSANMRHSQNSQTKRIDLNAPDLNFNVSRVYPFGEGNKWYNKIMFSYSSKYAQEITTSDTILFTNRAFDQRRQGFRHSVPLSYVIKPFNNFTITPSLNYNAMIYSQNYRQRYGMNPDSSYGIIKDTINGLYYPQSLIPQVNFSFTPKLYAMYQMANANAAIKALRHVISPGASLSLTPDVRAYMRDYNRYYSLDSGRTRTRYSIYDGTMYGTPTSPERSGYASFDLKNNLEMKIRNLKDTVTGTSKFILLEQFNFNSRYNLYADSLNWSDINLYASTRLFKNLIDVRADGRFNPYIYQDLGNKSFKTINKFEWDQNQRLGRLTYFKTSVSCNLSNSTFASPNNSEENKKKPAFVSGYDYFEMPWSFNFGYDITWDKPFDTAIVFQTLTFGGSLRFTKTLNASFNSGYDFLYKEFTYTTVSITKDLHCWEMSLNFSPLGEHKFYFFKINVKASTLQELKYEKRKNWRDF